MYKVNKRLEVAISHQLNLPYESKCQNLHGHNLIINIQVVADQLTEYGMVLDFVHIKKLIHEELDHKHLNDILKVNPTAENLCWWIQNKINAYLEKEEPNRIVYVNKVSVQESEGNIAEWSM